MGDGQGWAEAKLSRAVASWVVVSRNPIQEQCDDT